MNLYKYKSVLVDEKTHKQIFQLILDHKELKTANDVIKWLLDKK